MKNIDNAAQELALCEDKNEKKKLAHVILKTAREKGVYPWSINDFYLARGKGKFSGFTVPAINLRTMTYELARAIFRTARKIGTGAFIFEIAKSEMGYTDQIPAEYTSMCLAAAVKEGFSGPVFIQGDHFQLNAKKYSRLAYIEVLKKGLKIMDATAISLCMDNSLPIIVFNLTRPGNIKRIILGDKIGTIVK